MMLTTRPRERLSSQICRVVCIMQVLYRLKEATAFEVHAIVNPALPKPVCLRTIRRDLCAMLEVEFLEARVDPVPVRKTGRPTPVLYALKPPGLLNDRIDEFLRRRGVNRDALRSQSMKAGA